MEDRKGGILEVILVSARGIRKKDFIGKSSGYYVVVQCGNQIHRSRISSGEYRKAIWNQKFTFKFPKNSSWEDMCHLHLKILDTETFSVDNFIGEATIHLGGILTEGNENGLIELKPTPYNVVLEDDTYKGEIKIGLKFISDAIGGENQWLEREFVIAKKLSAWAIYKMITTNLWHIPRWSIFFFCNRPKVSAIQKYLIFRMLIFMWILDFKNKNHTLMKFANLIGHTQSVKTEMKKFSVPNESFETGYHPSPSPRSQTDQSFTDTTRSGDDSFAYCRTCSGTSAFSEPTDENSCIDENSPLGWSVSKSVARSQAILKKLEMKQRTDAAEEAADDQEVADLEYEIMRERFSKLLLGEDMSGGGKGVCTAVAISNAITNLYATIFGQNLRLEPLPPGKKSMWRREMECLLSVCDYIVEFIPASQNLQDKMIVEVMTSRPRLDIYMNLPALQKLDAMLLEILDSFRDTEFWYAEQGSMSSNMTKSGSFRKVTNHKEEKWWLPIPCVPPRGISEKAKKQLKHKRDCTNQIHKAAMAINTSILADMKVPDSYITALPKSGRTSVGDAIYRYMTTTDKFIPDCLLDCLKITSEHEALEIADRVEASMYTWRRKACMNPSKSSWNLMDDGDRSDKNYILAGRAETLLLSLKQRYPSLSQTTLDTSKIQYNKDVGQAILESYSRVLEGLAFNIVAWIEDVLHVDSSSKCEKQ